jgi:hypothetical protein
MACLSWGVTWMVLTGAAPASSPRAAAAAAACLCATSPELKQKISLIEIILVFFLSPTCWFVHHPDERLLVFGDELQEGGVALSNLLQHRVQQLRVLLHHLPHLLELRLRPQKRQWILSP